MAARAERSDLYIVGVAEPEQAIAEVPMIVRERIPRASGLDSARGVQVVCPMKRGDVGARSLHVDLWRVLKMPGKVRVKRFGRNSGFGPSRDPSLRATSQFWT